MAVQYSQATGDVALTLDVMQASNQAEQQNHIAGNFSHLQNSLAAISMSHLHSPQNAVQFDSCSRHGCAYIERLGAESAHICMQC